MTLLVSVLPGCAEKDPELPREAAAKVIDLDRGSAFGVALGDPLSRAETAVDLGSGGAFRLPPLPIDRTIEPRGEFRVPDGVGGDGSPGKVRFQGLVDDRVGYLAADGTVIAIYVFGERLGTREGVATGDSLDLAEETYTDLTCGGVSVGSDGGSDEPACTGRTPSGDYVWFGNDPIELIELSSERYWNPPS